MKHNALVDAFKTNEDIYREKKMHKKSSNECEQMSRTDIRTRQTN